MALAIKVSPAQLPEALREHAKQALKEIHQAVFETCQIEGQQIIQAEIDATSPPPVDRGTYRRSFKVAKTESGVSIYNPLLYASVLEEGRRPGGKMPPLDEITRWVIRKGLVKGRGRGASRDKAARAIAYVIARGIARKGMKPRRILARSEARLTPLVMAAIYKALEGGGPT